MAKTREDYPLVLKAQDIAEIMQVSEWKAYEVMEWKGFPLIRLGRSKRAPRDGFFNWMDSYVTGNMPANVGGTRQG